MGKIAQPREVALLKGADRKHPERYKGKVPKAPTPLGNAPDHLSPAAQEVWFEIDTYGLPGVMTSADRFLLEVTCVLISEFRGDTDKFQVGKYGQLISCLGRLGLSPADRQKLATTKPDEENPFDGF